MENTIKIIAIGKGGYEEGAVSYIVIPMEDLDDTPFPGDLLAKKVSEMRVQISEMEKLCSKSKNKKK